MNKENPDNIKEMFNRISSRYILMNKLMTFGQDRRWRRELIKLAGLRDGSRLLDVATGTGDVILEAVSRGINLGMSAGVDFSDGMLSVARSRFAIFSSSQSNNAHSNNAQSNGRQKNQSVEWIEADALELPFKNNEFDAVTSAYLMRNVGDIAGAFAEQFRVLKPGGRVACLDTTPPPRSIMSPLINFHLLKIIPLLGFLVAGSKSAYTYLPVTTRAFKTADELKEVMTKTGFENISYKKYMFNTIAIHWAVKPAEKQMEDKNE